MTHQRQTAKYREEGFYNAASEKSQIIYKGLMIRHIAISHQHWWKLPDKGSVSSLCLEKTRQLTILGCKTTFSE